MGIVYFKLENCYGIKSFQYTFNFNANKKAHIIYAPNGTMKTSFARTLQDICDNRITTDAFFPERKTTRIVKHDNQDGIDFEASDILVVAPYRGDYKSERMSLLLANQSLKNEYDSIHNEIDSKMDAVKRNLSTMSGKKDAISILVKDFGEEPINSYELLSRISDDIELKAQAQFENISYGKLFTPDAEDALKRPELLDELTSYVVQYNKLLSNSVVFQSKFDHYNAKEISGDLAKSGFFQANHKVLLNGESVGRDEKEFREIIDEEKRRIIEVGMAEKFAKLDTILDKKIGTRDFRAFISQNKSIIPELADVQEFKKKIWVSYLLSKEADFIEAVLCYKRSRERISEIINEAANQTSIWEEIVNEFNNRFLDLPYSLKIGNKEDVVLNQKAPVVIFHFKSDRAEKEVEQKLLLEFLSDGEKRALYLLNIIFEIKAHQITNRHPLIVFDDIADSFDYKNKYAIIEYLIDIIESQFFSPIILSHNFDFYRTLACRAGLKSSSWFAEKTEREISIEKGEYFEDVFEHWKEEVYKKDAILVASIAFLRNIEQYQNGKESISYQQLTALLHYKKNLVHPVISTECYLMDDFCDLIIEKWGLKRELITYDRTISVFEFIIKCARDISNNPQSSFCLEEKVVLAIACRLIAEKYMINRIADASKTEAIKKNQTRALKNLITFNRADPQDVQREEIINRVLIISSENIHINAFMYEPLVDIALSEIKALFNLVSSPLLSDAV